MRSRPAMLLLVILLALASTGAALAATPRKGAHYAGHTKQKKAISFDVSANGKRIVHPIFDLVTRCLGGGSSFAQTSPHTTATAAGPVKRGKFDLHFTEHATVKGGVKATARFTLTGRFTKRTRARGTARVTVHYSDGVQCMSSAVGYSVKS